MNYDKKTIRDIDVSGKKILLRCDFNVPHDKTTGIIHDDTRIVSTLPTIRYLLEHNAAVILLSHRAAPAAPLSWTLTTWTTPGRCWTRHPRWE